MRGDALLRSRLLLVFVFVLGVALAGSGDVVAQTKKSANAPSAPRPANIDRNGVLILIRSSLLALDQANKTGNYTVLRDLGAPQFQVNTAAKLAEVFVKERQQSLDLSGVAVLDPQLTLLPQIESNGMMRIGGFFPSVPNQLNFELMYAPVNREWKLFGISISVSQSSPVAPSVDNPGSCPTGWCSSAVAQPLASAPSTAL